MAEEIIQDSGTTDEAIPGDDVQIELMQLQMNGETFLIPVRDVSEILRPVELTPVPMAPDHLLGLANVHGQIVCIIDAGKALHLPGRHKEQSEETRFLILRHPRMHLGIWVDEVNELYRVAESRLPVEDEESKSFLRGEIDIDEKRLKLLNSQYLFE